MTTFEPASYGAVFEPLLAIDRLRALGAGKPDRSVLPSLEALTVELAFAPTRITDLDMARCCLAGVWLLHDFLESSHTISQGIDTPSGNFWHAIMHRREGDYSNAKYWFRRVGAHAILQPLAERAAGLADQWNEAPSFFASGQWDPFAFVDACQRAVRSGADADLCRAVQRGEWELLFDYCYRAAT